MWDSQKGYGFIISDEDDDELFVNVADLAVGNRLIEGQRVKFDVRSDMKGDKAVRVRVIK